MVLNCPIRNKKVEEKSRKEIDAYILKCNFIEMHGTANVRVYKFLNAVSLFFKGLSVKCW